MTIHWEPMTHTNVSTYVHKDWYKIWCWTQQQYVPIVVKYRLLDITEKTNNMNVAGFSFMTKQVPWHLLLLLSSNRLPRCTALEKSCSSVKPWIFNGIVDAFLWPVKYLFTQQMDVDNISNTLRHKPCPVGVFPIGVVTSSQLGCGSWG